MQYSNLEFLQHVEDGLSKTPKKLSSRYFYDATGDALFQQIMQLDEYYLPECEMEIIKTKSTDIATNIAKKHQQLQVVELGAGDGSKTKFLLQQFIPFFKQLEFLALDISPNILEVNKKEIEAHNPTLKQQSVAGDYYKTYPSISETEHARLVMFLGANIGNFHIPQIIDFFKFIKTQLKDNDYLLVAFDMVKHPRKIIAAYDDSQGITKKFNLNLLQRINRELGANFNMSKFDHFPFYNPLTGITSSQIISLEQQQVDFKSGFSVQFDAFEAIHTEVSKKFFQKDIEEIAEQSQLKIHSTYNNQQHDYKFVLFEN